MTLSYYLKWDVDIGEKKKVERAISNRKYEIYKRYSFEKIVFEFWNLRRAEIK